LLNEETMVYPPLGRSKEKTALVNSVMESLTNLLPGDNFLKRDIDSKNGFLIGKGLYFLCVLSISFLPE